MQVVCAEPDEGTKSASALCFRARCDAVSLLTPRAWSMARVDAARRDTHKKGGVKETQEPDKVIATTDSGTGHAANHGDSVAAAAAGAAGDGGGGGIGIASGSGGGGGGGGGPLERALGPASTGCPNSAAAAAAGFDVVADARSADAASNRLLRKAETVIRRRTGSLLLVLALAALTLHAHALCARLVVPRLCALSLCAPTLHTLCRCSSAPPSPTTTARACGPPRHWECSRCGVWTPLRSTGTSASALHEGAPPVVLPLAAASMPM
jgi:hypothetical protein